LTRHPSPAARLPSAASVTQRVERNRRFAYTEDGGPPAYSGGTSLEGRKCLRDFYEIGPHEMAGKWLPALIINKSWIFLRLLVS